MCNLNVVYLGIGGNIRFRCGFAGAAIGRPWICAGFTDNGRAMCAPAKLQTRTTANQLNRRAQISPREISSAAVLSPLHIPELCGGVQGNQNGSPAASLRLFLLAEERAIVSPGGQPKDRSNNGCIRCTPTGFRKHGETVGAADSRPWICAGFTDNGRAMRAPTLFPQCFT